MDWTLSNFDWNHARAFLATVETGSLSAAARALNTTQPTLGRQVAALEEDLDVVLFERIGRNLVPTPAGLDLADHVRAMRDAANRVTMTASGQSQEISGTVRITASDVLSALILPAALKELRKIAPNLQIDVVAANEIRDLQMREADIAIRHVRPEEPDLIAKLIGETTGGFYASKEYLAKHGTPTTREELAAHAFIGLGDTDRLIQILTAFDIYLKQENFHVASANGIVSWELARSGLGIIIMSDEVGGKDPDMTRLMTDIPPFGVPVWLIAHRELHHAKRIRVVFDFLAEFLNGKL